MLVGDNSEPFRPELDVMLGDPIPSSRTKTFLCGKQETCLGKLSQAQGDAVDEHLLSTTALGQSCLHHQHPQR